MAVVMLQVFIARAMCSKFRGLALEMAMVWLDDLYEMVSPPYPYPYPSLATPHSPLLAD